MNRSSVIARRFLKSREAERTAVARRAGVDPAKTQFQSSPLNKRVKTKKGDK